MTRHFCRHFRVLTEYPEEAAIPNPWRHLNLNVARGEINAFRKKLISEYPTFSLFGHSSAVRTHYSLLFATFGIGDEIGTKTSVPVVQIQHLFPVSSVGVPILNQAYAAHNSDIRLYRPEEIEVVQRLSFPAKEAILAAEKAAGLRGHEQVLYFGHAPILNGIACLFAGKSLTDSPEFWSPIHEGDRVIVKDSADGAPEVSYVRLEELMSAAE